MHPRGGGGGGGGGEIEREREGGGEQVTYPVVLSYIDTKDRSSGQANLQVSVRDQIITYHGHLRVVLPVETRLSWSMSMDCDSVMVVSI